MSQNVEKKYGKSLSKCNFIHTELLSHKTVLPHFLSGTTEEEHVSGNTFNDDLSWINYGNDKNVLLNPILLFIDGFGLNIWGIKLILAL